MEIYLRFWGELASYHRIRTRNCCMVQLSQARSLMYMSARAMDSEVLKRICAADVRDYGNRSWFYGKNAQIRKEEIKRFNPKELGSQRLHFVELCSMR